MNVRNRIRSSLAAAGFAVVAGWWTAPATAQEGTHRVARRDMICGPRAVEYVLFWYGKPEQVSDLIWELQGGDVSQPVNLITLAEALQKRQIYTKAVRLNPGDEPEGDYPAILHLNQTGGPGHYVVRVPPKDGRPLLYWSGTSGYGNELREEARRGLTGIVLLTSPTPIQDLPPITERSSNVTMWLVGAGAMVVGMVGLLTLIGRRRPASRTLPQEV